MITLSLAKWSSASGSFFIRERYYYKGRWTPFCKIRLRYFKTIREMNSLSKEPPCNP